MLIDPDMISEEGSVSLKLLKIFTTKTHPTAFEVVPVNLACESRDHEEDKANI